MFVIFFVYIAFVSSQIPLHKVEGKCALPEKFNNRQKQIILYAYNYGAKKGLGYTMAAIAWQESCAGEYMVNFSDPSAGVYHAHIPGVIKKYSTYKDSSFLRNLVGELLMRDIEFASKVALENLLFWQKNRRGNYKKIIKSYNKGFSWEKNKTNDRLAESYYQDIRLKVLKLKNYIPKYSKTFNNTIKIELENKNLEITNILKELEKSKGRAGKNNQEKFFIMEE